MLEPAASPRRTALRIRRETIPCCQRDSLRSAKPMTFWATKGSVPSMTQRGCSCLPDLGAGMCQVGRTTVVGLEMGSIGLSPENWKSAMTFCFASPGLGLWVRLDADPCGTKDAVPVSGKQSWKGALHHHWNQSYTGADVQRRLGCMTWASCDVGSWFSWRNELNASDVLPQSLIVFVAYWYFISWVASGFHYVSAFP